MHKIISSIFFLSVILFIGIVTSFEDFFVSKIRNKWIIIGLVYSLTIYSLSWILYGLAVNKMVSHFIGGVSSYLIWNFDKWCINLLISMITAYFLWHFKMWGAGDAKLFICYSALIPMGQYSRGYFNYYFVSFLLLLAIFIPATVLLFLKSSIYFINKLNFVEVKKMVPKLIKERLTKVNRSELGKVLLGLFVFFLFFRILREEFRNLASRFLPNQNILMLASLLVFKPISEVSKKNTKFIIIAVIIIIAYVTFKLTYSWQQLICEVGNILGRSILIMVSFPLFRKIIDLYEERTVQKTTPFAHWMFLGALITWFLR